MNIVSRSKEGRKWEESYKKLTVRFYDVKEILRNAQNNFNLETCIECENLKELRKPCPECDYNG